MMKVALSLSLYFVAAEKSLLFLWDSKRNSASDRPYSFLRRLLRRIMREVLSVTLADSRVDETVDE